MYKNRFISLIFGVTSLLAVSSVLGSDTKAAATKTTAGQMDQTSEQFAKESLQSPQSGEKVKWQVVSAGGSRGSSTHFVLIGTAGQTVVGKGTSTNYGMNQGFWQNFTTSTCKCGDADGSGAIDISDAVYLIAYIFGGGPAPNPICHGDADGSAAVDISDAVYLIAYIFGGGPTPHCP